MAKKKILKTIGFLFGIQLIIFAPLLIPIAAGAGIVSSISNFFAQFGIKETKPEELEIIKELVFEFKKREDYVQILKNKIEPIAKKQEMKYSYLILPLFLSNSWGSEHSSKLIKEAEKEYASAEKNFDDYLHFLKENEAFKELLKEYTETQLHQIFDKFGYLFDSDAPLSKEELEKLKDADLIYPLRKKAVVTSEFGNRNIIVKGMEFNSFHNGIDLAYGGGDAATCGIQIFAMHDGVISSVEKVNERNGYHVIIKDKEKQLRTGYWHLQNPPNWKIGEEIHKGDVVGLIGSTGISTACHLHLMIGTDTEWKNPRNYINFEQPKLP